MVLKSFHRGSETFNIRKINKEISLPNYLISDVLTVIDSDVLTVIDKEICNEYSKIDLIHYFAFYHSDPIWVDIRMEEYMVVAGMNSWYRSPK